MPKQLIIAFTNPVPGREDEFNTWYDDVHVAEVLRVPGFVAAQRFTLVDERQRPDSPEHPYRYVAMIETEGVTPRQAWDNLARARPGMVLSDSMADDFRAVMVRPITERFVAES